MNHILKLQLNFDFTLKSSILQISDFKPSLASNTLKRSILGRPPWHQHASEGFL